MSRIVITLPAYRAERTLEKTVAEIPAGVADEVILVDDASPDNTVAVAEELGLRVFVHAQNRGYGGNQKTCYVQALEGGADVIVLLHPDYQYDPKAVPLLIAPILAGYADMTFGSRFAGQGDPRGGGMPLYRFLGNRLTTTLENVMLGSRFTDMHSGLRAYTRECLLSVPFLRYTDDFSFDSQMLVDAATGGLRVVEVPIPTRYTRESSSIDVGRSLRYVAESLRYTTSRSLKRGRRGRKAPAAWREARPGPRLGAGPAVERTCVLCGATGQALLYPATASGTVTPDEFSCTSGALSSHDDIVQCGSCGMVSSIPTLDPEGIRETYAEVVDEAYLGEEQGRRELFDWVLGSLGGYAVPGRSSWSSGPTLASSWRWPGGTAGRRSGTSRRAGPSSRAGSASGSTSARGRSRSSTATSATTPSSCSTSSSTSWTLWIPSAGCAASSPRTASSPSRP